MGDPRPPHPRALAGITRQYAAYARFAGRVIGIFSLAAFLVLLLFQGVPRSVDLEQWEATAQSTVLAVLALGLAVSWRWEGPGAALLLTGGVTLGVLASVSYAPTTAVFAALAFVVPGILIALHWQRHAGPIALLVMLAVVGAVLAAGGYASARVYDHYTGPTHPESDTPPFPDGPVEWAWSGALTTRGFTVKAVLREDASAAELVVAAGAGSSGAVRIPGTHDYAADPRLWTFKAAGLSPGTDYSWAVSVDGVEDSSRTGHVRTAPEGPASFTFAFGSCMRTASNGSVFDAIRREDPLFFLLAGDFGYDDIVSSDPAAFASLYARNVTRPAQQALFLSTPLVYVWDDHDYGGNDANRYSTSRDAVREAYERYVPHVPLEAGDGTIFQAFTIGRVRFLVTDTRSARDPLATPPTMLGEEQKAWLKSELLLARDRYALTVVVNSVPWIAPEQAGADHWAGFPAERAEIATFIAENGIDNVLMLSGDAHMVAIDDGTNNTFAADGGLGFPVFHAAALDRRGKVKGGPYSEGAFPGGGQFGTVTVTDDGGDTVDVLLSGRDYTGAEILRYRFSIAAPR